MTKRFIFAVALVLISATVLFFIFNSRFQSQTNNLISRLQHEVQVSDEKSELKIMGANEMPRPQILTEKAGVPVIPQQLAKDFADDLKRFTSQSHNVVYRDVRFEDGTEGFSFSSVDDPAKLPINCPQFANAVGNKVSLRGLRKTAHFTRYEFQAGPNMIFAETEQRPHGCLVTLFYKPMLKPQLTGDKLPVRR